MYVPSVCVGVLDQDLLELCCYSFFPRRKNNVKSVVIFFFVLHFVMQNKTQELADSRKKITAMQNLVSTLLNNERTKAKRTSTKRTFVNATQNDRFVITRTFNRLCSSYRAIDADAVRGIVLTNLLSCEKMLELPAVRKIQQAAKEIFRDNLQHIMFSEEQSKKLMYGAELSQAQWS